MDVKQQTVGQICLEAQQRDEFVPTYLKLVVQATWGIKNSFGS